MPYAQDSYWSRGTGDPIDPVSDLRKLSLWLGRNRETTSKDGATRRDLPHSMYCGGARAWQKQTGSQSEMPRKSILGTEIWQEHPNSASAKVLRQGPDIVSQVQEEQRDCGCARET